MSEAFADAEAQADKIEEILEELQDAIGSEDVDLIKQEATRLENAAKELRASLREIDTEVPAIGEGAEE